MNDSNGDKAFLTQFDALIEEVKKDGKNKVDMYVLLALRNIYERVVDLERVKEESYPSLLYFMLDRPLEFWPIAMAITLFLSMIFVSESRHIVLSAFGLSQDLLSDLPVYGPPTILLLLAFSLINASRRKGKNKEN